jgi:hypothetical protein
MESNEHKEGFEIFLKEKADSYKMYPSEKVWANLNDQLHPRKKWPYFVVAAIFLGLGFGGKIYDTRYNTYHTRQVSPSGSAQIEQLTSNVVQENNVPLTRGKKNGQTRAEKRELVAKPSGSGNAEREINSSPSPVIQMKPYQPIADLESTALTNALENGALIYTFPIDDDQGISAKVPSMRQESRGRVIAMSSSSVPVDGQGSVSSGLKPVVSSHLSLDSKTEMTAENNTTNAINVKKPGDNRLGWQLYFSPTISYRKLYGTVNENSYSNAMMYSSLPGRPHDINSAVNHSPSVGMELGTAMIYSLGKRLRVKGGLQFNYSRYNIVAYNYMAEITPLSAAGIGHTEIKALSYHRNFDGFSITQLSNEHFSISMPVGLELAVLGNKDVQFNIAGTLQPGLMLNNQSYMLSTNLRNYAKVPSLYRDFNVNSAIEAFLSINMGSYKWNIGPQIRYQLLSSFKQNYPIKEHLYDYGFKVGMTKTLR